MKYKFVFWDWNGTLFDDADSAFSAVNTMLDSRELPNITFDQYREYIDVPIIRFYEKVMDMSNEKMVDISVEFNDLWEKNLRKCPLADGALELLNKLSDNGIKQFIFSSSHNELIIPYLTKYGLEKYFDAVLGASDCYVGSKAERTAAYIVNNGIPKEQILFVGDMVHDSEVARYVNADCALVSCGHQCERALKASGRNVYSSLNDLSESLFSK